jgi:hypothetical protein
VLNAGLEIAEDDDCLAYDANFVLSIVPPGAGMEVAERLRGPQDLAQGPRFYPSVQVPLC